MAKEQLDFPVRRSSGTYTKDGTVHRTKRFRTPDGKIYHEAEQEGYKVEHPRNYKKKPPTGEELRTIQLFQQASSLTTQILKSDEYAARRAEFEARFYAQIQRPDPAAPVDKQTGKRKQYWTLNTFIRAMLYYELKSRQS